MDAEQTEQVILEAAEILFALPDPKVVTFAAMAQIDADVLAGQVNEATEGDDHPAQSRSAMATGIILGFTLAEVMAGRIEAEHFTGL